MKCYPVVLSPAADKDSAEIFHWISERASPDIAEKFVQALIRECVSLGVSPARGTLRRRGEDFVRQIGFRRTVTIVFTVSDDTVKILRLLYRGRQVSSERLS